MLKLSLFVLLLSIPFAGSSLLCGAPLWAYASLGATLIYASIIIFVIQKRWHNLKEPHEL